MAAADSGKRKVVLRMVLKCDANGDPLPREQQGDIYHVFSYEEPRIFICSGPTAGVAMDIARAHHNCYFEGDPEDKPKPRSPRRK